MKRLPLFIFSALFFCVSIPAAAHAAQLSYVSDLITDSRPAYPANHTLSFEVMTAVPPAGSMIVRFEGGAFGMDPSFGSADASLATSTTRFGGYVERTLGASPDQTSDGFSAAYPEGPLTVTLSSGNGIPAGSFVELMLGTNAPGGVYQITNPTSTGSYHVYIDTYDAAGTHLDYGAAMVAIVEGVGVTPDTDKITPAILSNGLPSSTIPSNVAGVLLSFNTDEYATCRYATTSGVSYDAMTNMFVNDLSATFHTAVVMGITNGVTYRYYVRCVDFAGNRPRILQKWQIRSFLRRAHRPHRQPKLTMGALGQKSPRQLQSLSGAAIERQPAQRFGGGKVGRPAQLPGGVAQQPALQGRSQRGQPARIH